mmetsp:Transcript_106750/g.184138  ORF Transcript_106750/g.184138 Transcript_106750/m.184138 type:complete len:123 (-) Transcript_106750:3-371(-)
MGAQAEGGHFCVFVWAEGRHVVCNTSQGWTASTGSQGFKTPLAPLGAGRGERARMLLPTANLHGHLDDHTWGVPQAPPYQTASAELSRKRIFTGPKKKPIATGHAPHGTPRHYPQSRSRDAG